MFTKRVNDIWNTVNEPRTAATFRTLYRLRRWTIVVMVVSGVCMLLLSTDWGSSICINRLGHGQCVLVATWEAALVFFTIILAVVLTIVKDAVELKIKMADNNKRLLATLRQVERLVEHAKRTGFDFNDDGG